MQEIVINSRRVSLVQSVERNRSDKTFTPAVRRKSMSVSDFVDKLQPKDQPDIILPTNTRFVKTVGKYTVLALEDLPRVRTITVNMDMGQTVERLKKVGKFDTYGIEQFISSNKPPYKFTLSFPYVVYIIRLQPRSNGSLYDAGVWVFYRLTPISGMSDYLIKSNLLNVSDSHSICLGGSATKNDGEVYGATDACQGIIDMFWLNEFNTDYTGHYTSYSEVEGMTDFLTWAYLTNMDPMFIYKVPWIKHNETLGTFLQTKSRPDRMNREDREDEYVYRLTNYFHELRPADKSLVREEEPSENDHYFRNVAAELGLKDGILSVGDEVMYKNEIHYVADYLAKNTTSKISHVELETEKGDRFIIEVTSYIKRMFNNFIRMPKVEEVTCQGQNLKIDDILELDYKGFISFKQVRKIRYAIDGRLEVLLGSDYYLLENIDFKVLDLKDIEYDGVKLEVGDTYVLVKTGDTSSPISTNIYDAKYVGFEPASRSIRLHFVTRNGSDIYLRLDEASIKEKKYSLLKELKRESHPVIRIETSLITNHQKGKEVYIVDGIGFMSSDNYAYNNYDSAFATLNLLTDQGSRLYIPSFNSDIDFKIGDPVVVADWSDQKIMTTIFLIKSFEFDFLNPERDGTDKVIWVNLEDINKKVTHRVPYVNITRGCVNIGLIRHIIPTYGGITSGDKIRAKIARIVNFPKKDVNEVVGFISDTGTKHPLMLCSNGSTQWAAPEILERFTVYKRKSPSWFKFKNAGFARRFKPQSGDLFEEPASRVKAFPELVLVGFGGGFSLRSFPVSRDYGIRYNDSFERIRNWSTKEIRRWGFPTPRYSDPQMGEMRRSSSYPNLLGGYSETKKCRARVTEDWPNVQNSHS